MPKEPVDKEAVSEPVNREVLSTEPVDKEAVSTEPVDEETVPTEPVDARLEVETPCPAVLVVLAVQLVRPVLVQDLDAETPTEAARPKAASVRTERILIRSEENKRAT